MDLLHVNGGQNRKTHRRRPVSRVKQVTIGIVNTAVVTKSITAAKTSKPYGCTWGPFRLRLPTHATSAASNAVEVQARMLLWLSFFRRLAAEAGKIGVSCPDVVLCVGGRHERA